MLALQREIVDERRYRFENTPYQSGVGSIGVFGLPIGFSGSEAGRGIRDFRLPPISVEDLAKVSLSVLRLVQTENVRPVTRLQSSGLRERELEWRRTHAATLRQYENEWIVLEGTEIIAHGSNPTQVLQEAKARGIRKPYIFFVEQKRENVVTIGL